MLYVTTRDRNDAFTAYKTLVNNRGSDGGFYIPFRSVTYSRQQIVELKDKSFGQCVADVLNQFFSSRLDAWDVDFCIGRYPVKLIPMSHKIVIGEVWNNPEWDFSRVVRNLRGRILGATDTDGCPTNWTWIAVRIAVLFGLFGELFRSGSSNPDSLTDISVDGGDFTAPMAAWYAREMGLPIGNIIFSCDSESELWDFLNHGEMDTSKITPSGGQFLHGCHTPADVERLIYETLGEKEVQRFAEFSSRGASYWLTGEQAESLRKGLFCAVVSRKRALSVIRNVFRTNAYLLSPNSALAYGALQDFRATHSETATALILTEQGPVTAVETVSEAIGVSAEDLKTRIQTL